MKNKKISLLFLPFVLSLPIFSFYFGFALAEENSLCGKVDCQYCSRMLALNGLSRWIFWLSILGVLIFLALAIFSFLKNQEEEEGIPEKTKNWSFFAIICAVFAILSFTGMFVSFKKAQSPSSKGFYNFTCDGKGQKTTDGKNLKEIDLSDGFLGADKTTDSGNVVRPSLSGFVQRNGYLSNSSNSIKKGVDLTDPSALGDEIIKLDEEQMTPEEIAAFIRSFDSFNNIEFLVTEKNALPEDIIGFRNASLGFFDSKNQKFKIKKDGSKIYGDELEDPNGKIKEFLFVSPTDDPKYFNVLSGSGFSTNPEKEAIFKQGDLDKSLNGVFLASSKDDFSDKDVYVFSTGLTKEGQEKCVSSGGRVMEFRNECFANQEKNENSGWNCGNIYRPVKRCNCPEGSSLFGNSCEKDQDLIMEEDFSPFDQEIVEYSKTPCSEVKLETKTCPPSFCSGDKLMYYPPSAKDECYEGENGAVVKKGFCQAEQLLEAGSESRCKQKLKSEEASLGIPIDSQNNTSPFGRSNETLDNVLNNTFGKGSDVSPSPSGSGDGLQKGTGTGEKDTGTVDSGPLPPDKGALAFNPTPGFKELKECIGLKGDQIPYNGILVVLLNPKDPLNRKHNENISRMYYLSREGQILGKNGDSATEAGGQEYGARTFDKSWVGSPDGPSMWGRGWKIFKGTTKYDKNGWTDPCSFGSHDGYKTGTSERAMEPGNLRGGSVTSSVSRCGQHVGFKSSSAGCATMGNNSRCGFINTSKSFMSKSNGTIMQVNLVGELNPSNGKFESPDCGKIDYCGVKRLFEASSAKKFKNDPNDGYDSGDKRRITDC